jgi:hypothetical protein
LAAIAFTCREWPHLPLALLFAAIPCRRTRGAQTGAWARDRAVSIPTLFKLFGEIAFAIGIA